MTKSLLFVESKPASPELVEEYHRWNDQVHVPEMLTIDGFVSARRWQTDGESFVTLYEIDTDVDTARTNVRRGAHDQTRCDRDRTAGGDALPESGQRADSLTMTVSLAGKVAIVTGGASGLGQGIVEKFAAAGADVVVADVNDDAGEEVAARCGGRAWFRRADVADAADVEALVQAAVDRFGRLDVMVNNAGISSKMHKSFLTADLSDFQHVMSVNVLGVMLGTQAAARHMAEHDGGSIINISSIGGLQPGGGVMTYRASKAAVIHFSKSVATELAPLGISVNCIAPGGIPTPILASSVSGLSPEAMEKFIERTRAKMRSDRPLPREGTPEDVAEAALYFATSVTTTGTLLTVDGGTSART